MTATNVPEPTATESDRPSVLHVTHDPACHVWLGHFSTVTWARCTCPAKAEHAEPTGYQAGAAELRRIADALDALPPSEAEPFVSLSITPAKTAEAVDAVAMAVLGKTGTTKHEGGGNYRHSVAGDLSGPVYVTIGATVPGPPDERDLELERLRAEVEALKRKGWHAKGCLGATGQPCTCTHDALPDAAERAIQRGLGR